MTKDRIAALIFLLTGIYGLVFSLQLPVGSWEEPGPAVAPLIVSVLLVVSGVLTFAMGKPKGDGKDRARADIRQYFTPMKIVGLTGAFIVSLDRLGYFLGAPLFVFLLFFWVSRYRLWVAAALALGVGLSSWFFFGKILAVSLPVGVLSF